MKIAFIAHIFPRLHNTFILNEITELIRQGHEVLIFSIDNSQETVINQDVIEYGLLSKTFYFDDFLAEHPNDRKQFEKYIPFFRNRIFAFRQIAEKIKEEKCDAIHGIFGNNPATAAMILSELSGVPFSFETHAYDLFVDFPFAEEKVSKAKVVFTESVYNQNFLKSKLSADYQNIHIMRLAPNKKFLDSIEKQPKRNDLIVSACRLHPIKGLKHALKAVNILRSEFQGLQYVIIGDGPLREELEREVDNLALRGIVHFAGEVSNEKVCKAVQQCSVMLLPCEQAENGDRDGTPTAICEAMYLKVPIVSTRFSGIPELVDHGVNGFLTECGDVQAMVEALRSLLKDRSFRGQLGERGKEKIEREFNIEKSVKKFIELWEPHLNQTRNSYEQVAEVMEESKHLFREAAELISEKIPLRLDRDDTRSIESSYEVVLSPVVYNDIDVSVVIPTFNREELLKEAIESVCQQEGASCEIVIVNDCGDRLSAEFISQLTTKNIPIHVIHHKSNLGLGASRNTGASVASGHWLMVLDDDDVLCPGSINALLAQARFSGKKFIYGDHYRRFFNESGDVRNEHWGINQKRIDRMYIENEIVCATFIIDRMFFNELGGYREDMKVHEDFNLHLRVMRATEIEHVDYPIFVYNNRPHGRMNLDLKLYWFGTSVINHTLYRAFFGVDEVMYLEQKHRLYEHIRRAIDAGVNINSLAKLVWAWWQQLLLCDLENEVQVELSVVGQKCPELLSELRVYWQELSAVQIAPNQDGAV